MPTIEIIYATIEAQDLLVLQVAESATIQDCIDQSDLMNLYPEIDLVKMKVGIFSQVKPLNHVVKEGDRIEIYRPLIADPKAVRRKKAEAAQK
jgi:putative ubiquitin-RnfH superfamily antitoxin RatB of RatAB toxin-antitoxin module